MDLLTVILVSLFVSIILFDCFTLLKKVGKRDKIIYFSAMLVSFAVLLIKILDIIPLPSAAGAITSVLEALFHIKG